MRTLRLNTKGEDVRAWETFLVGINPACDLVVDDIYDEYTKDATEAFQKSVGFTGRDVDGLVGPMTFGKAMGLGFDPTDDVGSDPELLRESGPNWPPIPEMPRLSLAQRRQTFGNFAFQASPVKNNPEAIKIIDGWEKTNIEKIVIPQLVNISGAPRSGSVSFHAKVAVQIRDAFQAVDDAGLADRILSWGGSWVPRYIRGSRRTLSNHAWGTAFDINVPQNYLGTRPALKGQKGSVREMAPIFTQFGLFWGGWYSRRKDGMHFEIAQLL